MSRNGGNPGWAGATRSAPAAFIALALFGTLLAAVARGDSSLPIAARSAAYADGPPPGFSGGFGEESCHACHFAEEPNDPGGTLTVDGFPERYRAGETYPLVLTLSRPRLAVAGFELAVRVASDGRQAGRLAPPDAEAERITVTVADGIEYAYQLRPGSVPTDSAATRWSILWTAPETASGAVRLNVAANAADGDESTLGDFIYTAELESTPDS